MIKKTTILLLVAMVFAMSAAVRINERIKQGGQGGHTAQGG